MTGTEIAAVLNAITRIGIAWTEYGALIDRARAEGREVTAADVADLGKRARVSLDKLNQMIASKEANEEPEPEPEPETETDTEEDPE